ncbi:MAG: lipid II flippase MurJ [Longimicrobiales bacterium]
MSTIESNRAAGPPPGSLRRPFVQMFAGGVLGKVLGLIREVLLAATFGTGSAAAAFRAAQTATLVPTHTFANDTLNGGFIPLCGRYLREDPARARTLYWSVAALMGAISLALATLLFVAADAIVAALVPGFSTQDRALTAAMLRAMAIGVPFYVQAVLANYAEMAAGRYVIASIRAAVQNVGLIAGILAAALFRNPLFLGWGFTAYSVLFAAAAVSSIASHSAFAFTVRLDAREALHGLREFGRLVRPLLLLPILQQGAFAAERFVASLIATEAVASIDYARAIADSALVLLAIPLGMAGLSELGKHDAALVRQKLERLLPALLLVTVPFSIFLAFNAAGVVQLAFGRGRFDQSSVAMTALILTGLAFGFWAHASGHVLARALSAHGRNGRVAATVALAATAHIVVNAVSFQTLGALGLGMAASASGLVLLAGTARALHLHTTILRTLGPLAAAAILYMPAGFYLRGGGLPSLALSAAVLLACLALAVLCSRTLRNALATIRGPVRSRPGTSAAERVLTLGRTS